MTEVAKRHPIRGMMATETRIVLERLSKVQPGETVTYRELDQLTACDIRQRVYVINTARNKLLSEEGKVFVTERGIGVRLLENEEIAKLGTQDTSRISHIARRCAKKLAAADYDALSSDGKIRHNANMTVMMLFQRASTAKSLKLIEEKVKINTNPLPMAETLKLFSKPE